MSIATTTHSAAANPMRRTLVIGVLSVIYSDIGTSPIHTLRECLKAAGAGAQGADAGPSGGVGG